MRAFISYLLIVPIAVVTLLTACSAGGGDDDELDDSGGTSNRGGSGAAPGTGGTGASPGTGGTRPIIDMTDGGTIDACQRAGLPPGCETVAQPGCGDQMVQEGEECDDGNNLPGDCCSGSCKVEKYCECPPGEACRSTIVCGDGKRGPGEACDDANTMGGDGCSADCHVVEIGYRCAAEGLACIRHYVCGDGSPDANEGCDDANRMSGDGCSDRCRIELGFKCDGMPSACSATTCGDMVQEGAESCDDGNTLAFDGCSPDCRAEPTCETGEACSAQCGDGIVFGDEQCDDGNLRNGDGCSAECAQEEGYSCNNDAPCTKRAGVDPTTGEMGEICSLAVPAIFRDFNGRSATSNPHPDFSPGVNSPGAVQNLVNPMLDEEGKPVLRTENVATAHVHTRADFEKWYRSTPAIPSQIVLWDKAGALGDGSAGYVNRWGANGETWNAPAAYINVVYGGPGGGGCTACAPTANGACFDPCTPWGEGSTDACCAENNTTGFDGNPLFFPIDAAPGILTEMREQAKVPEQYGWNGWPWEDEVAETLGVNAPVQTATAPFPSATHNFNFTTEVKYWFKYDAAGSATLDFTGDDDVWVFLNGHLVVDLGAWHVPLNGTLTIDAGTITTSANLNVMTPPTVVRDTGTAADYGLEDGKVYQIAVFHAERQKEGSSFKLTLAGFNMTPSDCRTQCGDGMVGPGEECDDGTNLGAYNECAPECVLGPRCGDGVTQTDAGETCDDGINAGDYGGCGPDCKAGPHCGDSVPQLADGEECDDGQNRGDYGGCAIGCKIGPHCGDGTIAVSIDPMTAKPYEECDDANDVAGDGCSNCKIDLPKDAR
jgi:fibro-slime domain-containing protein